MWYEFRTEKIDLWRSVFLTAWGVVSTAEIQV
jgi:hypothetical protein